MKYHYFIIRLVLVAATLFWTISPPAYAQVLKKWRNQGLSSPKSHFFSPQYGESDVTPVPVLEENQWEVHQKILDDKRKREDAINERFRYELFISTSGIYRDYSPPRSGDSPKYMTRTEVGTMASWQLNENIDFRGYVYYEHYDSGSTSLKSKPILRFGLIDAHTNIKSTYIGMRLGRVRLTYGAFNHYQDNPVLRVIDHQPQSFNLNEQVWKSATYGNGVQLYATREFSTFNATVEATFVKPSMDDNELSYALMKLPAHGYSLMSNSNKTLSVQVRVPMWELNTKWDRSWIEANYYANPAMRVSYVVDYLSVIKYWGPVSLTVELAKSVYPDSVTKVAADSYGVNLLSQYRHGKWIYAIGYNQWQSGVDSSTNSRGTKRFEQRVGLVGVKYKYDDHWTFKAEYHKNLGDDYMSYNKLESRRLGNMISISTTYKF